MEQRFKPLTRAEAIALVGLGHVVEAESIACEFNNKRDGLEYYDGVHCMRGLKGTVTAVYTQEPDATAGVEDLSSLDWTVDHYLVDIEEEENDTPLTVTLNYLADNAGIWTGPAARRDLCALAVEMLPEQPTATDFAKLFEAFKARRATA